MAVDGETVKTFIKGTLGCGCSDELFDSIEVRGGEPEEGFDREVLVGGRLLVRTLTEGDRQNVLRKLPRLIADGFDVREEKALNRFRLVVFCQSPEEMEAALLPVFVRLSQVDDRIHLHVLPLDENTLN